MPPRFSIVYPTRDRPEFVREALAVLRHQGEASFEVVVSDNYLDPALSCEEICQESGLENVVYVHPRSPLGMVENWNHALRFTTGEYICYLTDKMLVLPGALRHIEEAIRAAREPEIVSWVFDEYNPDRFPDYFGAGVYLGISRRGQSMTFRSFSPRKALDHRGHAAVARFEQSPADYARGKLLFGAYRRELVDRIIDRFGSLFHNINPDYTSMVLGLSAARNAIELTQSCVVAVNTDISNGSRTDTDDSAMLAFLESLVGGLRALGPTLLVPGLYASQHNGVAHDYISLKSAFGLSFAFNHLNWLAYCHEDIYRPSRRWSRPSIEAEHKRILAEHVAGLDPRLQRALRATLARRAAAKVAHRVVRGVRRRLRLGQTPRPVVIPAPSLLEAIRAMVGLS